MMTSLQGWKGSESAAPSLLGCAFLNSNFILEYWTLKDVSATIKSSNCQISLSLFFDKRTSCLIDILHGSLTPIQIKGKLPSMCLWGWGQHETFPLSLPLVFLPPLPSQQSQRALQSHADSVGHKLKTTNYQILVENYQRFLSKRVI